MGRKTVGQCGLRFHMDRIPRASPGVQVGSRPVWDHTVFSLYLHELASPALPFG